MLFFFLLILSYSISIENSRKKFANLRLKLLDRLLIALFYVLIEWIFRKYIIFKIAK